MYRGHRDQIVGLMVNPVAGQAEGVQGSLKKARWMMAGSRSYQAGWGGVRL